jgi:phenylpropionate dioxygenase-like ring-hydroxylating dioxygenase large terminal subunit
LGSGAHATGEYCTDQRILDLWHPIAAVCELVEGEVYETLLLGESIRYRVDAEGQPGAVRVTAPEAALPVVHRHGYLWTSLGSPIGDVFDIPETAEPDRRSLNAASIMVATSAPRAIENFLDMGHFPYVHTDYLGVEPRTEVVEYQVEIENDELWARDCFFYQPMAAASAVGGQLSEYTYRVPHPYCVMLYKSSPSDPTRSDVIGLFVQAMTEETVRAHNFLSVIDDESSDTVLRRFQQIIFSQDKPILENQYPKRLPLDPRVEVPIRADQSAIVYRRWLTDLGVTYSVVPAA